jgi:hypothetical protein
MSSSDLALLNHKLLSSNICEELVKELDELHPARWVKRTKMHQLRATTNDMSCSYSIAANRALGTEMQEKLLNLAPTIEKHRVAEVVINRYLPGDFISKHLDRAIFYVYNMTIALQTGTDGVEIEGIKYPDVAGNGVVFRGPGLEHSVPPVTNKRYTLIYLYEHD